MVVIQYVVNRAEPLKGEITISGAKNSALKLMAATVLTEGRHRLRNVPRIVDVDLMAGVLRAIGLDVEWGEDGQGGYLDVHRGAQVTPEAPYEMVEQMRASTAVMGPLLAAVGEAHVAMPGGDDFGTRPIDMHMDGLRALGAEFDLSHGVIHATTDGLKGADVVLDYPSVGATENLIMAAALAEGRTVVSNAAREPEIADLAAFLNRMGAQITGAGSPRVEIVGVEQLRAVEHAVIPDRLEVATYLAAVGVAGGEVTLRNTRIDHLELLVEKMGSMGMRISPQGNSLWAMQSGRPQPVNVATLPYPGLATDFLPLLVAVLAYADGISYATENVFSGRFGYVGELHRMGARIDIDDHHLVIEGCEELSSAPVRALDIRAGAAMVVAALGAEGQTVISEGEHIDRGYEDLADKLGGLGASVSRVET